MLHAGESSVARGYKVSGGLHGVGLSVVNALSEWLTVEIRRDGHVWTQGFERGVPTGELQMGEPTDKTGTSVTFMADLEIFEEVDYKFSTLSQRLREMAFLTKGLKISLTDERGEGQSAAYQYENGIKDFVAHINSNKDPIHKASSTSRRKTSGARSRWPCSGTPPTSESIFSFANSINTQEVGTHLSGFRAALTRVISDYARTKGLLKERRGAFR